MEEQKDMVLEVENLNVKFVMEEETVEAVNNISLHIKKGETLGLVGETGAGKTTTALSIMRLVDSPPGVLECDKLEVCGQDVMGMSITELEHIRGGLVSMIFQDPMTSLNPVFTVGQQIAESLERHEHLNKNDAWKKAEDMLELVGIPRERAIEYPHQFSGGMKQRQRRDFHIRGAKSRGASWQRDAAQAPASVSGCGYLCKIGMAESRGQRHHWRGGV